VHVSLAQALASVGHYPVVAGAVAVVVALAPVLRSWIAQNARTRRFTRALEDTEPSQRAEIIAACSQMEAVTAGDADYGTASVTQVTTPELPRSALRYGRRRRRRRNRT
jgi:hypothetical protein